MAKKKMRKLLLTNLLAVAIISTVDESINSRYSRSKNLRRCADGAGTKKFSRKLQCSADEDSADKKRCARYGMSCDDISLDVITISSWLSADESGAQKMKRRRVEIQQMD
ncbi:peroxiredoxin-2B-like [Dorcoceras hygrometricum]|uniref:Peroxiredoxin-2B-like n=1 Tax=Dorcoceras hygrometricum TaxID=472368 RepID=A0A2Z7D0W3_9LAMI|nr:peroxiredoxin-2B-like [Dorcoceras hygrometricum]